MEGTDEVANDAPLSMEEAVKAYAATPAEQEADHGQSEAGEEQDGEDIADESEEVASEELEAAEDEGEPDEEGQADEEASEDEEQDSDGGRFVSDNAKVRLADGSIVSIADLKSGNLKERDYRQKTMELAEQRKAHESQSAALKQAETQVAERLEYAEALLKSFVPQPPDIALLNTDPVGYMQQKAQFDQLNQHLAYIAQTRQQDAQKAKDEEQQSRTKKANEEWDALLGKAPEFKDDNRTKAFLSDIQTHGTAYGFTMQELQQALPMDHRQALVLRDAIAWRKLQASKGKMPKKAEIVRPPVQKGGKRLNPAQQRAQTANQAMERLNKTGSLRDGVAAYLASQKTG